MKIINAIADQAIDTLTNGDWQVHTTFEHTFNLTDNKHLPLILVTSIQEKRLPGAVYLPERDFHQLKSELATVESITLAPMGISIKTAVDYWQIMFAKRYTTQLQATTFKQDRLELFLQACQQVTKMTGFDYPFADFLTEVSSPLNSHLAGLVDQDKLGTSLDYLIGRGRGLTPAGDDLVLGWLLIDQLTNTNVALANAINAKIATNQFTTDVSRNYLNWALQRHYSNALTNITDYLSGAFSDEAITELIAKAIDYGSSSGVDSLTGIVSALIFKRIK